MSGDVQPRKRKDKKRKKDDSVEQIPLQPRAPSPGSLNEDVNIHVHKEDGTGGGICAKIVFFILFSALAILIGLIITEHRGLTDLDTSETESRFSHLFEGWIDNSLGHDEHDDDHIVGSLEDDDHEEEAESHEAHDEEEEEDEDEGHDEDEDAGHDDDEEEEQVSEEVAPSEEEQDEEEAVSEETPQTEEEEEEEEEEEDDEEEETAEDEEPNVSEVEEVEDDLSEIKDADGDDDEEISEENADEDEEQDEEEEQADEDDAVASEDADDVPEQSEENVSEEPKDEEEPLSKEEEEEEEEATDKEEVDEKGEGEENDEGEDQQNSKMVIKIGVGVALLVVAHVVLVRKWKSASPSSETPEKEQPTPDLSRRNTIVVPPTFQEIERDIEYVEEEYSDEDGEVESDEERLEPKSTKLKYQELRSTYTRSLTPESEPEEAKPVEPDDEDYGEEEEEDEEEEDEEEEVGDEEEEEDESETGEYEKEDEDEDLLQRLEARYGKLQEGNQEADKDADLDDQFSSWKRVNVRDGNEPEESDSDKQSDNDGYEYENITNKDDLKIKEKIDEAHKNIQNNTAYAIKLFDVLLQNYPSSPRSLYGKAQALDVLADRRRSNDLLQKAIALYSQILDLENVPDTLFEAIAERCINRLRFMGNYSRAIDIHYKLISRFPEDPKYRNHLVVSFLTMNRVNKARIILQEILSKYPNDGFALVHYGFILKTVDNKLKESISYLQRGISTKAPGVIDGRFYFHLGDALARLGKTKEAMKVYEDGVKHNLFLSKYQRSLYNVEHLKGQPWWKKEETPYKSLFTMLENNWEKILQEGISVLNKNGLFQSESENLKDTGDWKQFELFARGQKNINNCKKCPITCKIIENIPGAKGCKRGQTKFSVMHPGTHVWPHCGPTNCRLRVHLGLQVPSHTYIRVADEIRSWKEGQVLIFDDSFEHEVWHNGTSLRLVLIVDVWHPELTSVEKRTLSPI